jgi:hypothetical protein
MVATARGRPAVQQTSRVRVCAPPSPRHLQGRGNLSKARRAQAAERSPAPTLTPQSRSNYGWVLHAQLLLRQSTPGLSRTRRPAQRDAVRLVRSRRLMRLATAARATAGGGLQWRRPWQASCMISEGVFACHPRATQMCARRLVKIGKKGGQGQEPAVYSNLSETVPSAIWPPRPRANQGRQQSGGAATHETAPA